MSTYHVDSDKCVGHALCFLTSPEIYAIDDDGFCSPTSAVVAPERLTAALAGAHACPEQALTVTE